MSDKKTITPVTHEEARQIAEDAWHDTLSEGQREQFLRYIDQQAARDVGGEERVPSPAHVERRQQLLDVLGKHPNLQSQQDALARAIVYCDQLDAALAAALKVNAARKATLASQPAPQGSDGPAWRERALELARELALNSYAITQYSCELRSAKNRELVALLEAIP